jgi:hypothetical protein
MLGIADNIGVSRKIFPECFSNIGIDRDLVAFAAFLLFDLETLSDRLPIIYEMTDPQTQEIRNPQSGVDSHGEQQQIAKTPFTAQQVFDLRDLFAIADRFNKIHKML